jgi:hypothetical protein
LGEITEYIKTNIPEANQVKFNLPPTATTQSNAAFYGDTSRPHTDLIPLQTFYSFGYELSSAKAQPSKPLKKLF